MRKTSGLLLALILLFSFQPINAESFGKKKVKVSVSEADARITVNGILVGNGQVEVVVPDKVCVYVKVEKVGFLTIERTYCNQKNFAAPPKEDFFKLEVDEAYTASVSSDVANVDISVQTDKEELAAWRLISQIITSYFDVIEVSDSQTVYLRTAWSAQNFRSGVIRTRVIVKLGSSNPNIVYKVKLVSEYSTNPNISVKNDESFRAWGRVLRKYEGVVSELQSRLSK